jgi:hypothetical protein
MLYQAIFVNKNGDAIRVDRVTAATPEEAKAAVNPPAGTASVRLVPMDHRG